jgi:hypothetical protein
VRRLLIAILLVALAGALSVLAAGRGALPHALSNLGAGGAGSLAGLLWHASAGRAGVEISAATYSRVGIAVVSRR